ncbi:hypothetical protein [Streptomyces sp. NPDC002855]|uniref:hypothetical protein n=1 Tax=Streptomyces sp. NPDC002855 TaxID=3154437 RepID=UPI003317FB30
MDSFQVGCQTPRILALPAKRKRVNREAVALARAAGVDLDPWQEMLIQETLAESDDLYFNDVLNVWMPKYAAYEAGIVVSRQNGKGEYLNARALAGLYLLGERLIAWTAHEQATAKEGFQRLEALLTDNPELAKEIKHIHYANGNEGIEMKSGQRVIFKTRTKKALRGFTVDTLLMDEAMILDPDMAAAMMFAISARPNAQMVLTGSAGDENSIQFGRVRSKAIAGTDPRVFFAEWSADVCTDYCPEDCSEHDAIDVVSTYAKANPGLGYRIEVENIDSERTSMDRERFCRERLSVGTWPVEGDAWAVIPKDAWDARATKLSAPRNPLVFGVEIRPDRRFGCIVAAGFNGEVEPGAGQPNQVHVEVTWDGQSLDHRSGIDWLVPRCIELHKRNKNSVFVIDKSQQAGSIVDELEAAGLTVLTPTTREYAQWCGVFYSAIVPVKNNVPYLVHTSQPTMNAALAGAIKRELADLWAWDKRNAIVDISPLVGATLALYGHDKVNTKKTPAPMFAWG